jgi:hypothetical protein
LEGSRKSRASSRYTDFKNDLNDCHSGESRNPVILDNEEEAGHRFSPVRRFFSKPSKMIK